jgi:tetratricopeptide (TPR) repeat protein
MKTSLKRAGLSLEWATKIATLAFVLLFLAGCNRIARSWYQSGYDRDISSATKAIESARDNAHLAEAYAKRGSAYSEKARYSRAFKLISADEYDRLFGLALKDHEQAIALDPARAEVYYTRGETYYDRAVLETMVDGRRVGDEATRKAWFDPATADFRKAIARDGQLYLAWDRLGLIHETTGELDEAISDYSQEMTLNPLGKMRLADAYCTRAGSTNPKDKKNDAVIADYEKSIDIDTGASADGCSCDPYNPLIALYTNDRRYDQAWGVVDKARKSKKWIEPASLDRLKKESGRTN